MNKPQPNQVKHHYAGVLLVTQNGRIIGQRRDDKPDIDNPGKIGAFGGTVEVGEEPREAAWRELTQEETNIKLSQEALKLFLEDVEWRDLTKEWEVRHFYYTKINDSDLKKLNVYEGQGWAIINGVDDTELIELCKPVIRKLAQYLDLAT